MAVHTAANADLGSLRRASANPALLLTVSATAVSAIIALGMALLKAKTADNLADRALSAIGDAGVLSA